MSPDNVAYDVGIQCLLLDYRLDTHISHVLICFLVKINQNVHIVNVCSL